MQVEPRIQLQVQLKVVDSLIQTTQNIGEIEANAKLQIAKAQILTALQKYE